MKPMPVSLLNPLELVVDRIGLHALVEDNIRLHTAGELTTVHNAATRLDAQLRIAQLREFAAWLETPAQLARDHITVHLYPESDPETQVPNSSHNC